jgi:hypothetical protein
MERYLNNDDSYWSWVNANTSGFVINSYKSTASSGGPWMLHRATCTWITNAENPTTGDYYKMCSINAQELTQWAEKERAEKGYKDTLQRCTKCNP